MIEKKKPVQPARGKTTAETKPAAELGEKQLDSVTGGTSSSVLMNACATGTHIKQGTITH